MKYKDKLAMAEALEPPRNYLEIMKRKLNSLPKGSVVTYIENGEPGCGKSTLSKKVFEYLKKLKEVEGNGI